MPSFTSSPQVRLYGALAVLSFSLISLLFLFQESLPVVKHAGFSSRNHSVPIHETAFHRDPPPESPPYGALVIAAQNITDLSWTIIAEREFVTCLNFRGNLLALLTLYRWNIYEYDVDKPDNKDPKLRFPETKGHEAMVYLSFIIDHYDDLPWSVIFVHGHREAWHQEDDIFNIVGALNRVALARQGYISLRCDWYPSCPAEMRPIHHDSVVWGPDPHTKGTEAAIAGNWRLLFPDEQIPDTIASPCCAQFAVTRQAIMKRPKTDYERLREWLMSSLLEDYLSGRVIEKLWAYLFTGRAV